jgi:osmotically-inducible protein OsmY
MVPWGDSYGSRKEHTMNAMSFVRTLMAGAGLMYLLDPRHGRRRRAQLRDRAAHLRNKTNDMLDTTSRDLQHRAEGVASRLRFRGRRPRETNDQVLEARVRSELGRVVSHPSSIQVLASGSSVQLRGPILAREVEPLLAAVRSVKGVKQVEDRLEVHRTPGRVPGICMIRRPEDGGWTR